MSEILELTGFIENGKIDYSNKEWRSLLDTFKKQNDLSEIMIRFEKIDTPMYYCHKFYRGYLIPAVAHYAGEVSEQKLHLELKKEFLYIHLDNDLTKIKKEHKNRPTIYVKENGFIDGYTPSTGDITHREMLDYIKKVENRLVIDLNGALLVKNQEQAATFRRLGMNSLLDGEQVENKEKVLWGDI